ncbi:hypothetical protein TNCV_4256901 [Trichonephila clavipes]|nr:hypothetical protein TNCV_4256901 [Trichonephila clavipes]
MVPTNYYVSPSIFFLSAGKYFLSVKEQNTENISRIGLFYSIFEEFIAVDDDKMYTVPIMVDKDILEFVQSSKNSVDADFDDENEMKDAGPVPTSSKMRNVMKSY